MMRANPREAAMLAHEIPIDHVVDLEALDSFLISDRSPPDSMMLSDLDGFLTGIAIGPELVLPSAVTETLFGSLKVERLHGKRFATRRQAKDEVIDWFQFYNHRRLHSTLGYLSPMAFEKKRLADKERFAA
jgi:hypothetical protein